MKAGSGEDTRADCSKADGETVESKNRVGGRDNTMIGQFGESKGHRYDY